ncbi:MAG: RNA-binding protein [Syntrophomonadaceae bacterium]|nr:RNA-binding protein [Syntrophomonadaceae bacterium]
MMIVQVINAGLVMVVDGDLRKIENPKVKNIKHVQFTKIVDEGIKASILNGEALENHMVRKSLKKIMEASETEGKGGW